MLWRPAIRTSRASWFDVAGAWCHVRDMYLYDEAGRIALSRELMAPCPIASDLARCAAQPRRARRWVSVAFVGNAAPRRLARRAPVVAGQGRGIERGPAPAGQAERVGVAPAASPTPRRDPWRLALPRTRPFDLGPGSESPGSRSRAVDEGIWPSSPRMNPYPLPSLKPLDRAAVARPVLATLVLARARRWLGVRSSPGVAAAMEDSGLPSVGGATTPTPRSPARSSSAPCADHGVAGAAPASGTTPRRVHALTRRSAVEAAPATAVISATAPSSTARRARRRVGCPPTEGSPESSIAAASPTSTGTPSHAEHARARGSPGPGALRGTVKWFNDGKGYGFHPWR